MSKAWFGCWMAFFASAGLALGQAPPPASAPMVIMPPEKGHEPKHAEPHDAEPGHELHAEANGHEEKGPHKMPRFWGRSEYLLWWIKNSDVPPLLTTGSPVDARPGALGMPTTQVLFGLDSEEHKDHSGGRFTVGWWSDHEGTWGVEAGYLFLGSRSIGAFATSNGGPGSPVVARPYFDVLAGQEDASLTAFPGLASGSVGVYGHSSMQGGEANGLWNLRNGATCRIDALAGFRYLCLDEDLRISEFSQIAPESPRLGGQIVRVSDLFDATNDFYGAQIGARVGLRRERWFLDITGKLALGTTHQNVRIGGATTITPPDQFTNSGLLALPTNSGSYSRDSFAVIPEVGFTAGFQIAECCRLGVGYTFLYWSEVARPGNQIDRGINVTQVPTSQFNGPLVGAPRPGGTVVGTDFWAQGLNFMLEFRY